jgi:hypothetical protein
MATTKRNKKGHAAARRAGAAKPAKSTTKTKSKSTSRTAAKPHATAKPGKPKGRAAAKSSSGVKPRAAARVPAPKRAVAKPAVESAEVAALKAKLQRERSTLEKRLTEAMREIGLLRHHELRAMQLERQLAERDATIARLQSQLAEIERRPAEPVYVHEIQQTLTLSGSANVLETHVLETEPADLDEFDDDPVEIIADED